MNKRVVKRLLVLFIVATSCICLLAMRRIPLGLDLRGGVQIVLQVLTDDVLKAETQSAVEMVQQEISKNADPPAKVAIAQIGEIRVSGMDSNLLDGRIPGWDATPENDSGLPATRLRLQAANRRTLMEDATAQSMRVVENRLNDWGVSDITVQRYGDPDDHEIQVQVPAVTDSNRIKEIIQSPGLLEFRMVERGPFESAAVARASYGSALPAEIEILRAREGNPDPLYYAVHRAVSLSGRHLRTARSLMDEGRPVVGFTLNAEGARKFSTLTESNIGKQLAIVLDGVVQSAARIDMRIDSSGIIRGSFTREQVRDLALILRSGALPARTLIIREEFVGPSLGEDSIRAGLAASATALTAVSAFVIAYYRTAGVNAVIAMLLNLLILLAAMASVGGTLTLPGIAGIVLTIGVGIDSNVLIFERIREELRAGKTMGTAVAMGFQRVFRTLIDTHLAAMISAAILFMFSSGTVRGFAVTLAIGLLSNLFTSVFVSRTLFEWFHPKGPLSI